MSNELRVNDPVLTDENNIGFIVEIDDQTIAPDKLVKIRIGQNVYVWVKMSDLVGSEVMK